MSPLDRLLVVGGKMSPLDRLLVVGGKMSPLDRLLMVDLCCCELSLKLRIVSRIY